MDFPGSPRCSSQAAAQLSCACPAGEQIEPRAPPPSHRLHLENALENWRTQGRGTTPGQVGYSGETGLFAVIRRELHFSQAQLSPRDDGTMSEAQSTRSTSSLVPKTSN